MNPSRIRPVYDSEMMDSAIIGISRRKRRKKESQHDFVKKHSIDFTAQMWGIIEAHRRLPGVTDSVRETIYKALLLLQKKESL